MKLILGPDPFEADAFRILDDDGNDVSHLYPRVQSIDIRISVQGSTEVTITMLGMEVEVDVSQQNLHVQQSIFTDL